MALPAASFPAAIVATPGEINTSFDNTKTYAGVTPADFIVPGAYLNQLAVEIKALETTLGVNPHGSLADLVTRLAVAMNNNGTLKGAAERFVFNGIVSPAALGASTNDYDPAGTGLMSAINVLRLSAGAAYDLTGLLAGTSGQFIILHNVGSNAITLKDESTSSAAANRFALTADISVVRDQVVVLQYDTTDARWRAVSGGSAGGAPSGSAGGDLSGTYPNPTVAQSSIAFAFAGVNSPAAIGADQNDYNPASLSTANCLRLTASAAFNITGLAGGATGRLMLIHNIGSFNITLKDESASSAAANRFALTGDVTLMPDSAVLLQYDNTSTRWRMVGALADASVTPVKLSTDATDAGVTEGRLTMQSGSPVSTDQASATTLYFSPYKGNRIALYTSSRWKYLTFSETAVTVPSTIYRLFDIFAYDNAGTVAFETVNWNQSSAAISAFSAVTAWTCGTKIRCTSAGHGLTNADVVYMDTTGGTGDYGQVNNKCFVITVIDANNFDLDGSGFTGAGSSAGMTGSWRKMNGGRATSLALQDGVWTKNGDSSRKYVGTCCTTNTSGQVQDNTARRFVWNFYHQCERELSLKESTNNWTFTLDAWRAANGNNGNYVEAIVGVKSSTVSLSAGVITKNSSTTVDAALGIGASSHTTNSADRIGYASSHVANGVNSATAHLREQPSVGYLFYSWLERSTATGTQTWYGNAGDSTKYQSGLTGWINA